jgi:hypothetical protein
MHLTNAKHAPGWAILKKKDPKNVPIATEKEK